MKTMEPMKGVIVAPQPRACDVGAEILTRGGNVFDAAVATAFAQEIDDPFMCGIGGMGAAQLFHAPSGTHVTINFHTRAGSRCRPDMYEKTLRMQAKWGRAIVVNDYRSELGYQSIMTPGTVAGLGEIHRRFGSLPWADLVRPAARLAREGMWVMPYAVEFWERLPQPGLADGHARLAATEECRGIYLRPDGTFFRIGDRIPNPGLADTLETLAAEGADSYYRGTLAERIAADLEANDAFVTGDDLAAYSPREMPPVRIRYRGYEICAAPPPTSGVTVLAILKFLEASTLGDLRHNSAEHLDLLIRAMTAAHADRAEFLGDPDFTEIPTERMLSDDRAAEWRRRLADPARRPRVDPVPDLGTTHISAADSAGSMVSITHTLGTASGVVTPGMGFVYNNSMKLFDPHRGRPNSVAAGKARSTGMAPVMVLENGRPILALGAPGGSAIISSVAQTLLNILDFGMSPAEAVTAPRIHSEGGDVQAEARVPQAVCAALEDRGHRIIRRPYSFDPSFSRAQAVQVTATGWRAGSDPRTGSGGTAFA